MALAQRTGLMVTPAVRFASGEPARAAGVTAALAEAAVTPAGIARGQTPWAAAASAARDPYAEGSSRGYRRR
jgi:hypothetical protein